MQQPKRYYITKSGEEPTVRSVRVEQPLVSAELDQARRVQMLENSAELESGEQRRTVKDLVQSAITKRQFFS